MEKYEIEYFNEYQDLLKEIVPDKKYGMSLTGMKVFGDLILTAIEAENEGVIDELGLTNDGLWDALEDDPGKVGALTALFSGSQEKEDGPAVQKNPSSSGGKSKGAK